MLVRNVDLAGFGGRQLVNGSRGVIVGAVPSGRLLEAVKAELSRLAGLDSDRAERAERGGGSAIPADLAEDFADVAAMGIKQAQDVLSKRRKNLEAFGSHQSVPRVRFGNKRVALIFPEDFMKEVADAGQCHRVQARPPAPPARCGGCPSTARAAGAACAERS